MSNGSGMVEIVDTSVANIASMQAALRRLGFQTKLVNQPQNVKSAEHLVLPGVGSFGAAMNMLNKLDLVDALRERFNSGRSTLAICLGMQLLCESSEEAPGVQGLGILPMTVKRFGSSVQVPQLGWNEVVFEDPSLLPVGHAYFANSFRIIDRPEGWNTATTDYDGPFFSSILKERILVCQFHPELSGRWGERLLKWWLDGLHPQGSASGGGIC